jgi:hypothetical protein
MAGTTMSRVKKQWQRLRRAVTPAPSVETINEIRRVYKCTVHEAAARLAEETKGTEYYLNDVYQVQLRRLEGKLIHLNIRRIDGEAIMRDWRHFQQIKNELVGPECEAVELYPAESRKADSANKYHLFAVDDPTFRFPIGFNHRDVQYSVGSTPGTRQRPRGQMSNVLPEENSGE